VSQSLISWVREDFGLDLAAVDRVDLGADNNADLWRCAAPDGRSYAVKLSGGGTPAGLVAAAHLARNGVEGVPAPLTAADGRVWSERAGRRLSVVPWVSDRVGAGSMTPEHWRNFGALLARVHAAPVTGDVALLPRETYTHERWVASIRFVHRKLGLPVPRHGPDDVDGPDGDMGGGYDHVSEAVAKLWAPAADGVMALVARADALGAQLRARQAPGVVCHADPHLNNVLLGDDGQVWLIDWDDATLAPRELDLMLLLGGMGKFGPRTEEEHSLLFGGYGPVEPDHDLVVYFRCRRAIEDVCDWAVQSLDAERWTVPEREEFLEIVRSTLRPDGIVALALRDV